MRDVSPAIDRAWEAARRRAADSPVRLAHLILALLEDDEGRPAALLGRIGFPLESIRGAAEAGEPASPVAPAPDALHVEARGLALALRGEPEPTTEFLLLAALATDAEYAGTFGETGLTVEGVQSALRIAEPEGDPLDVGEATFTVTESAEVRQAARAVDANLNRAAEALRVLDDYCRFVLDDKFLTSQWKALRHRLADAAKHLPTHELRAARNTPHDVGATLTGAGEYARQTPAHVAAVNAKRLQESLRSLEEFGKLLTPEFAREAERLRYEAYTLEAATLRSDSAVARLAKSRLYALLTGAQCAASLDWTIAEAAEGGVDIFQMREKEMTDRELLDRAKRFRQWTRKAGSLFIVNDRPDIARLANADGVHLGQDDLPVAAARRIVGPDSLIGVSTHTVEQVRQAVLDGADYLGVGPVFTSQTKSFEGLAGLEFVRAAAAETTLPIFALGGIGPANIHEVVAVGGTRMAVSAAVATADDVRIAATVLRNALPR